MFQCWNTESIDIQKDIFSEASFPLLILGFIFNENARYKEVWHLKDICTQVKISISLRALVGRKYFQRYVALIN